MISPRFLEKTVKRSIYFLPLLLAIILFGILGYLSNRTKGFVSKITFTSPPTRKADRILEVNLWGDPSSFIYQQDKIALINEKNPNPVRFIKFFCPRSPYEKSTLTLRFKLEKNTRCDHAFLQLSSAALYSFDPYAKIRVAIASEKTRGEFVELAELSKNTEENLIPEPFDVTEYVRDSGVLDIRLTAVASKLLYHPTPNDPIGFAGAQLLRQARNEYSAATLKLWFTDPNQKSP